MDNKKFVQIGTIVMRDKDGEIKIKPVFTEAQRLYKLKHTGSVNDIQTDIPQNQSVCVSPQAY